MIYSDAHSHVHLCNNPKDEIAKAEGLGVKIIVCNAMGESDWDKVTDLAKEYKIIKPCLGIHPAEVKNLLPGWDKRLELHLRRFPEAMAGETGLDKTMDCFEEQKDVFERQLDLAEKLKCPMNVHCYKAWPEMMAILRNNNFSQNFIMHSHHGDVALIPELVERGAYFSYSAIFTLDKCVKVRECLKGTPIDRLLIESDAPDLAPSPANIPDLLGQMAEVRGEPEEYLAENIRHNLKVFMNNKRGNKDYIRFSGRSLA